MWRTVLLLAQAAMLCGRVASLLAPRSYVWRGTVTEATQHPPMLLQQQQHHLSKQQPRLPRQAANNKITLWVHETKTEVAAAPEHRADIEKATLRRAESQPALQQHIDRLHRVGRRKLKARQHVNPLASSHQQPVQLVDGWYRKAFADTTKPLHLDIGCAYGRFCLDMATADPTRNYLGLDIRWPVVAVALCKATERTLDNCHFISCNANVNLERILGDVIAAGGVVERVSVQFPDPHFKTRNKKKRVLKPELVETIQQFLSPGGTLFMQGDIHEVQREMRLITRKVGTGLQDLEANVDSWLSHNPMGIPTERELAVQAKGGDVYRCMFKKR